MKALTKITLKNPGLYTEIWQTVTISHLNITLEGKKRRYFLTVDLYLLLTQVIYKPSLAQSDLLKHYLLTQNAQHVLDKTHTEN